jgi:hypothetical protein
VALEDHLVEVVVIEDRLEVVLEDHQVEAVEEIEVEEVEEAEEEEEVVNLSLTKLVLAMDNLRKSNKAKIIL